MKSKASKKKMFLIYPGAMYDTSGDALGVDLRRNYFGKRHM